MKKILCIGGLLNRRNFLKVASAVLTFPFLGFKPKLTGIDLIIQEVKETYLSGEIIPSYRFQDEWGNKKYCSPLGVILYKNFGWNILGKEAIEKILNKYFVTKMELAQMGCGFDLHIGSKYKNEEAFQKGLAFRKELNALNIEYDPIGF